MHLHAKSYPCLGMYFKQEEINLMLKPKLCRPTIQNGICVNHCLNMNCYFSVFFYQSWRRHDDDELKWSERETDTNQGDMLGVGEVCSYIIKDFRATTVGLCWEQRKIFTCWNINLLECCSYRLSCLLICAGVVYKKPISPEGAHETWQ